MGACGSRPAPPAVAHAHTKAPATAVVCAAPVSSSPPSSRMESDEEPSPTAGARDVQPLGCLKRGSTSRRRSTQVWAFMPLSPQHRTCCEADLFKSLKLWFLIGQRLGIPAEDCVLVAGYYLLPRVRFCAQHTVRYFDTVDDAPAEATLSVECHSPRTAHKRHQQLLIQAAAGDRVTTMTHTTCLKAKGKKKGVVISVSLSTKPPRR